MAVLFVAAVQVPVSGSKLIASLGIYQICPFLQIPQTGILEIFETYWNFHSFESIFFPVLVFS